MFSYRPRRIVPVVAAPATPVIEPDAPQVEAPAKAENKQQRKASRKSKAVRKAKAK